MLWNNDCLRKPITASTLHKNSNPKNQNVSRIEHGVTNVCPLKKIEDVKIYFCLRSVEWGLIKEAILSFNCTAGALHYSTKSRQLQVVCKSYSNAVPVAVFRRPVSDTSPSRSQGLPSLPLRDSGRESGGRWSQRESREGVEVKNVISTLRTLHATSP